jgi:hypothetical protein
VITEYDPTFQIFTDQSLKPSNVTCYTVINDLPFKFFKLSRAFVDWFLSRVWLAWPVRRLLEGAVINSVYILQKIDELAQTMEHLIQGTLYSRWHSNLDPLGNGSQDELNLYQLQVETWVVTRCSVVVGYQSFRGSCCLPLQGDFTSNSRCRQHVPPKRWYPTTAHTASQPRRPRHETSLPCKPQNSHCASLFNEAHSHVYSEL